MKIAIFKRSLDLEYIRFTIDSIQQFTFIEFTETDNLVMFIKEHYEYTQYSISGTSTSTLGTKDNIGIVTSGLDYYILVTNHFEGFEQIQQIVRQNTISKIITDDIISEI